MRRVADETQLRLPPALESPEHAVDGDRERADLVVRGRHGDSLLEPGGGDLVGLLGDTRDRPKRSTDEQVDRTCSECHDGRQFDRHERRGRPLTAPDAGCLVEREDRVLAAVVIGRAHRRAELVAVPGNTDVVGVACRRFVGSGVARQPNRRARSSGRRSHHHSPVVDDLCDVDTRSRSEIVGINCRHATTVDRGSDLIRLPTRRAVHLRRVLAMQHQQHDSPAESQCGDEYDR